MSAIKALLAIAAVTTLAVLAVLLINTRAALLIEESESRVLENDNALQGQVIATQVFNINRFNHLAQSAARANAVANAGAERRVIHYREILKRETTCDFPVPATVADGLLAHANRLRASALRANTRRTHATDAGTVTSSALTYCQAVLWIEPLLSVIEQGNNQLSGIRKTEQQHATAKSN